MKVFISADIEGVAGLAHVDECNPDHKDYPYWAEQMTQEVKAACDGAVDAGATEILVKDAHWTGRNIDAAKLPRQARVLRNWSGHPQSMTDGLDESFAACAFVGYHAAASTAGNPLAHTISGGVIQRLMINGERASEFKISTHTASMYGVPCVFLSGDQAICDDASTHCDAMQTVATLTGKGSAAIGMHPLTACEEIRAGMKAALTQDLASLVVPNPKSFVIEIEYKKPPEAYHKSFYPGVELVGECTIRFETEDWFEALRAMSFII